MIFIIIHTMISAASTTATLFLNEQIKYDSPVYYFDVTD